MRARNIHAISRSAAWVSVSARRQHFRHRLLGLGHHASVRPGFPQIAMFIRSGTHCALTIAPMATVILSH
jgi:hypothetical protein